MKSSTSTGQAYALSGTQVLYMCPTSIPENSTNATPSDIPPTLIFPSITPAAITMAKTITMCATELVSENKL